VGLASAYKISRQHPGLSVAVLEKEDRLAAHQTGHNSGVIHSGLYYQPGSTKAITCAQGRKELVAFAREHGIAHKICGKVIVATRDSELPNLERVYKNGTDNQVEGIEKIDADRIRHIEPFCRGIAGIYVPCAGVIDFVEVAEKLAELIEQADGNKVLTACEVMHLEKHDFFTRLITSRGAIAASHIINCAGLWCDKVAQMDGFASRLRIVPFRGDYYRLAEKACQKARALLYPVPDPAFPFLGVHFTRMIDGSVECGPNAVFSFKREGYDKRDFSFADTWQALSYSGTWLLFARHWRYGLGEYCRAFSKKLFLKRLRRLIPSLEADEIVPGKTGVRAQALGPRGELIDDFVVQRCGRNLHVLNAPSPAATACLAIGEHIRKMAERYFDL